MSRTASSILESGTTDERQLKRAELYLYMDRTEVLNAANPEPIIQQQKVDKVWIIEERSGGGEWRTLEVFINDIAALKKYEFLSRGASTTNGYWEVSLNELHVSTS